MKRFTFLALLFVGTATICASYAAPPPDTGGDRFELQPEISQPLIITAEVITPEFYGPSVPIVLVAVMPDTLSIAPLPKGTHRPYFWSYFQTKPIGRAADITARDSLRSGTN